MGSEARPRVRNEASLKLAAHSMAKIVHRDWDADGFEIEEVEADLLKAFSKSFPLDGYNIAKALEDYCGWDPDAALVEMLDGAHWEMDRVHSDQVAEWVKVSGVTVPFSVGERVMSPKGIGIVTEVKPSHAKINVRTSKQEPNSAWVFDAERCHALTEDETQPTNPTAQGDEQ